MADADKHGGAEGATSQTVRALLGLRELILKGELAAGARVSEVAVSARLRVSRTPVRAALARLEAEGMLASLPGGGYSVHGFTVAETHDAIEVRGTLEGLCVRLAAERGVDPLALSELRTCADEIDAVLAPPALSVEAFARYVTLNDRFHRGLADLVDSAVVRRQLERASSLPFASPGGLVMVQAKLQLARETLRFAQSQHRAVIDAITGREGSRAEALMREHARIARGNLDAALRDQGMLRLVPGAGLIHRRAPRR